MIFFISIINGIFIRWSKKLSFPSVKPISTLEFGQGICIQFLAWSKASRKFCRLSTKELSSLLEVFISSWWIKRCLVSKMHYQNNLIPKDFLSEPLLTSTFWCWDWEMLKMLCWKINIYDSSVRKFLWYLSVKWKQFAQTRFLHFDRH